MNTLHFQKGNQYTSAHLVDSYNRTMDYLRLAVTDRCNLRCQYCMPAEGIPLKSHEHILRFDEIEHLVRLFTDLGVRKLRITGGEPFVRKGTLDLIKRLNNLPSIETINITTNAVFIADKIADLQKLKIGSLNISLDTLKKEVFFNITRRDEFDEVYDNLQRVLKSSIPVKLNMVVLAGINDQEIIDFSRLASEYPVEVRFIEQMPFSGGPPEKNILSAEQIFQKINDVYPQMYEIFRPNSTARVFTVPGFTGRLGIIAGYSRTFCSSCNRLRLTPEGMLQTCLYDQGSVNLKQMLRTGETDQAIKDAVIQAVKNKAGDGFEAQKRSAQVYNLSMAQIGG